MKNQIALFIMTYKGLKTLQSIVDSNYSKLISYVVIGEDRNTTNDYSSEIRQLCIENGIDYYSRKDNLPSFPEYILTVSWRWLIKNCSSRIIVLHESLLPKYRGFAPLVNQLINKEEYMGVSAIFGEKEYDTGDIIAQKKIKVEYPIKINQAIINISELYKKIVVEIFAQIVSHDTIKNAIKQDDERATYSLWRDMDDYLIDWSKSSEYISRFIDSVGFPYTGALTYMNGKGIRIIDVESLENIIIENRHVGKIIYLKEDKPVVVCGEGLLLIKEAFYDESKESIFPLKRFRIRFK
jgi:methionyl-tRNA formyltransferase